MRARFVPIRWIDAYGRRELSDHERLAAYRYYYELDRRMGISRVPPYDEFERFNREYEREHFRFTESSRRLGEDNLRMVCEWFPRPLRPLVRRGFVAGLEPPMCRAFGFAEPAAHTTALVRSALRLHGAGERCLPARTVNRLGRGRNLTYPGYPTGYDLDAIGAE